MEQRSAGTPTRSRTRIRAVGLVFAVSVLLVASGCDWTEAGYRGRSYANPYEDRITAETAPGLALDHTIDVGPGVSTDPIVVRGSVVVPRLDPGTGEAMVSAWSTGTGTPQWSTTVATGVQHVSDVVAQGTTLFVAVQYTDNPIEVISLDVRTGAVGWRTTLPPGGGFGVDGLHDQLALADGKLLVARHVMIGLVGRPVVELIALDAASGATSWTLLDTIYELHVVVSRNRYVALSETLNGQPSTRFTVFDGRDGTRLWDEVTASTPGGDHPVAAAFVTLATDGRFYGAGGYAGEGAALAFQDATGLIVANGPPAIPASATPKVVLTDTEDGGIAAVDPSLTSTRWAWHPTGNWSRSKPTIAGDLVHLTRDSSTGPLYEVRDLASGTIVADLPVGGVADPVVSSGRVYLRHGTVIDVYALT